MSYRVRAREETISDWLSGMKKAEGSAPTVRRLAGLRASEAVSGEALASEMAVSERRGLARGSPAEWGKRLLLLLLLGGCSGRIHRLTLTVSPAARRSGVWVAALARKSPWFGVVSSGWSGPAPPASRSGVVSSEEPPRSSCWSCLARRAVVVPRPPGGGSSPETADSESSKFLGLLWGR